MRVIRWESQAFWWTSFFLGLLFGWKNFLTTSKCFSCCCCFFSYTWMCAFKKKHWTRWQGKLYKDDKERRNQKANHQEDFAAFKNLALDAGNNMCFNPFFFWNWWFHPCFWFFNFCGNICWRGKNMSWGDFILHKGGELLVEEEGGSCCVANANFFSLIYSAAGGASPASASSVVASEVQRVKLSRKSCMINVESL